MRVLFAKNAPKTQIMHLYLKLRLKCGMTLRKVTKIIEPAEAAEKRSL